ncbi:MAG TPA: gamma-glutamyltransferase, partial [Gemmataceae bacterium]
IDFDMDIQSAVDAPRLHHAWFPDTAGFEGTCDYPNVVRRLEAMGHSVHGTRQGDAHSIAFDPKNGKYVGAADHRINGKVSGY